MQLRSNRFANVTARNFVFITWPSSFGCTMIELRRRGGSVAGYSGYPAGQDSAPARRRGRFRRVDMWIAAHPRLKRFPVSTELSM